LTDAVYRVGANRVVTSPNPAGSWDARMRHGSAPAALIVCAAETIPTPQPMQIARFKKDTTKPSIRRCDEGMTPVPGAVQRLFGGPPQNRGPCT
jgi:hypothetical protein